MTTKEGERVHNFAARVLWNDEAFKKFQILEILQSNDTEARWQRKQEKIKTDTSE